MLFVMILLCVFIFACVNVGTASAMLPGKYTQRAKVILNYARDEAKRLKHDRADTEHLLLGLVHEGQGIAAKALEKLDISLEELETETRKMMERAHVSSDGSDRPPNFSPAAQRVMQYAADEAQKRASNAIGTEHILLGLMQEKNGIAAKALASFGVTAERILEAIEAISPPHTLAPPKSQLRGSFQDGARDATEFIQQLLLEKAGKAGGEVFLPSGRYRLDGSLTIPPGVALKGSWTAPHHARLRTGTVLLAYGGRGQEDAPPLISLSPGSTISGLTIFYPEQTIEDIRVYPWTIQGRGMHNSVIDVTLVNPYMGIDIGTYHNELHYLRNIFGCPLKKGIYINNCTDVGRIENVHFNPHYWARDEGDGEPRPAMGKLMEYLRTEGEAFIFGRTDWEYVLNTFCYGYRIGYHFIGTKQGGCNGNFLGIGADGGQNAVVVDKAAPYGLLITNGEFVSMRVDDPVEIIVGPENSGAVQFNNCAFWGPSNQIARIAGSGAVSFVQCNFVQWDHARKNLPAIQSNGGSLTVQSCNFRRRGKQIHLGPEQRSAVIFGNQMTGEIDIDNESSGDVQIGFNVTN